MKAWQMRQKLREGEVLVTFKKKNGEIRQMLCTLQHGVVPEVYGSAPPTDELVTAWDLEHGGWRSFKVASVVSFDVLSSGVNGTGFASAAS